MNEDAIFSAALAKTSAAERSAYLDSACSGDIGLRQRIEKRLQAQLTQMPTEFPADKLSVSDDEKIEASIKGLPEGPGALIGPYKLIQPIGSGGMGIVYLAEQLHPV